MRENSDLFVLESWLQGRFKPLTRVGLSPEQIAGRLKRMNPDDLSKQVSHQTIYAALYARPKGERRQELIESLRQWKQNRGPRRR